MSTWPMIRRALPSERSAVAETVATAFAEDPGWAYIFGEEYERLASLFVAALFDLRVDSQNVWVTDDQDLAGMESIVRAVFTGDRAACDAVF